MRGEKLGQVINERETDREREMIVGFNEREIDSMGFSMAADLRSLVWQIGFLLNSDYKI
jgi:hypothetical protein